MKLHRFCDNSQHHNTLRRRARAFRTRAWVKGGLLVLLALILIGLTLTIALGARDGASIAANPSMAHGLSAQESPLSPLSIAFNNDAATAKRAQPAAGDPGAGGPSNLLRVMIVIAGVLLVTGIVFWRQR